MTSDIKRDFPIISGIKVYFILQFRNLGPNSSTHDLPKGHEVRIYQKKRRWEVLHKERSASRDGRRWGRGSRKTLDGFDRGDTHARRTFQSWHQRHIQSSLPKSASTTGQGCTRRTSSLEYSSNKRRLSTLTPKQSATRPLSPISRHRKRPEGDGYGVRGYYRLSIEITDGHILEIPILRLSDNPPIGAKETLHNGMSQGLIIWIAREEWAGGHLPCFPDPFDHC